MKRETVASPKSIRKVQLLFPKGVRTGGPKCLFQLGRALAEQGLEVEMVPSRGTARREPVADYEVFGLREGPRLEDHSDVLVITPETSFTEVVPLSSAPVAIWWLSVDFAVPFELSKAFARGEPMSKVLRIFLRNTISGQYKAFRRVVSFKSERVVHHLAHSDYAKRVVDETFGVDSYMVSDFTIPPTTSAQAQYGMSSTVKANQVSFNPKKGGDLVARLAGLTSDFNFVPISGLAHDEVVKVLSESTAYLDLGQFPGKDHLPREAIRAGTPVLVGKRGSAASQADFPLPKEFKIDLSFGWESRAIGQLEWISRHRSEAVKMQFPFYESVVREPEVFEAQVKKFLASI